jgi:hypothetical protein
MSYLYTIGFLSQSASCVRICKNFLDPQKNLWGPKKHKKFALPPRTEQSFIYGDEHKEEGIHNGKFYEWTPQYSYYVPRTFWMGIVHLFRCNRKCVCGVCTFCPLQCEWPLLLLMDCWGFILRLSAVGQILLANVLVPLMIVWENCHWGTERFLFIAHIFHHQKYIQIRIIA